MTAVLAFSVSGIFSVYIIVSLKAVHIAASKVILKLETSWPTNWMCYLRYCYPVGGSFKKRHWHPEFCILLQIKFSGNVVRLLSKKTALERTSTNSIR